MKEEFKSDFWSDFRQRYQGTYGWFEKDNHEKLLVYLRQVDEDRLSFQDKDGFKFTANADQGNTFTFIPVVRGCFNYGENGVVVTRRLPARMWKRGVCDENTSIFSLDKQRALSVTFPTLEGVFGNKPNTAFARFKQTLTGNAAIDNVFSVVGDGLYLYENRIGEYANREFTLTSDLFQQEVNDLVNRHHFPIIVSVGKKSK